MSDESDEFLQIFGGNEGRSWAILGPKGSGKSCLAATIANGALKRKGVVVFSNMLLKKWAPADPAYPERDGRWVEAYPRNYHKVTTFVRFFELLPDLLEQKKQGILIIDEALIGVIGAGGAITQQQVRDAISVMVLARKLRTCVIVIAQASALITSRLRDVEGGLLTGYILKRPHPGYAIQEIAVFQTGSEKMGTRKEVVLKTEPRGIGMPEEFAREHPGEIVLDSMAAASFSVGNYPGTNKPFDIRRLLVEISDSLSDDVPEIIRNHFRRGPEHLIPELEPAQEPEDQPAQPSPAPRRSSSRPTSTSTSRGQLKLEVIREFESGSRPSVELARRMHVNRGYLYEVWDEWRQSRRVTQA